MTVCLEGMTTQCNMRGREREATDATATNTEENAMSMSVWPEEGARVGERE